VISEQEKKEVGFWSLIFLILCPAFFTWIGYAISYGWNMFLVPDLPAISTPRAIGLYILCRCLFATSSSSKTESIEDVKDLFRKAIFYPLIMIVVFWSAGKYL
jgi:hypothetical protein